MPDNTKEPQGLFSRLFNSNKVDPSTPVDKLIDRIDSALSNLNFKSTGDGLTDDQLVTKSISDVLMPNGDNSNNSTQNESELFGKFQPELESLFKDFSIPDERILRYKTYDSVYNTVQILKNIISVYLDNIFQKDQWSLLNFLNSIKI